MHVFAISDGPYSGTGFGEELRQILFRFAQHGHEVTWLSLQHFGYPITCYDYMFPDLPHKNAKIRVVGNWGRPQDFGSKIFPKHYKEFTPDLVLLMGDPYLIDKYARLKVTLGFPLVFYVTLDGLPIPPEWKTKLEVPNVLVTMTDWARKQYANLGVQSVTIHHGINWWWWSTTKERKQQIRRQYEIPDDCTVFISWDLPQHRKRPDALIRCWKQFRPETKNTKLVLWSDWDCRIGHTIEGKNPLTGEKTGLLRLYDIPRETVLGPRELTGGDKLWEAAEPPEKVREIAQLGDVYVSSSSGEGFGRCNLEAMSMGIPVVATKYSAIPEVVGDAGILIPCYRGQAGRFRWHSNIRHVEGGIVNERKFAEALNRMYDHKDERVKLGLLARERAKMFDYEKHVVPRWLSLLEQINPDLILSRELLGI